MSETHHFFTDQSKSTLKLIAAGVGLFGFLYLGKKLFNKLSREKKPVEFGIKNENKKGSERLNTKVTEYSEYYFDKDLQLQIIESTLSEAPTVQQIYLNSPIIAQDQFIKYTRQIRKRRRLIRKTNEDQYINLILTYEQQIKQLLYRSRLELIEYLNLDVAVFQTMEENFQVLEDLRGLLRKSEKILKAKLLTETKIKKISDENLKRITEQQLGFIRNQMYDRLRKKLQNDYLLAQNQILIVVQTLLEDIIYEKFGYEYEDIVRKMEETGYKSKQRSEARKKMGIDIGQFNYDSIESSEEEDDIEQGNQKRKIGKSLGSYTDSSEMMQN